MFSPLSFNAVNVIVLLEFVESKGHDIPANAGTAHDDLPQKRPEEDTGDTA